VTDTITRNSSPTVPIANLLGVVHGWDAAREVEHILHPILNGDGYNVTYKPVRKRRGSMTLLFPTAADADAAVDLLVTAYSFTLNADEDVADMTFVLAPGRLDPRPQEGIDPWLVVVPFQEV
jgi:hypothetical protein